MDTHHGRSNPPIDLIPVKLIGLKFLSRVILHSADDIFHLKWVALEIGKMWNKTNE